MLAGVLVEHKLRQRPVQARQWAFHHGEAAAGDFHRCGKVQLTQAFADIHVVAYSKSEGLGRAPAAHLHIGGFVLAHRHRFVRQVRHAHQEIIDLGL